MATVLGEKKEHNVVSRQYIGRNLEAVRALKAEGKTQPTWDDLEVLAERIDKEIMVLGLSIGRFTDTSIENTYRSYDKRMGLE